MKIHPRWTAIICLTTALIFNSPSLSLAVDDAIIAVVDDELITLKDLNDYAQSTYVSLTTQGMPEAEIQAIMANMETEGINKLIEDKLILSEANKLELEVREELVDERMAEIKEKYGTEQNFTDALIKAGATITDLRNKIRDEMKLKFVVDYAVKSKLYVNPQEVTRYYEENKEQFSRKERVNLESVFVGYGNDKDAASVKAGEALKQIKEGGDFLEIAKKYSEMPSVGSVERGQLLPLIEETVFNLKPDEVSSLVKTDSGIFIFKLTGKTPAKIADLEDVKGAIHDKLFKNKFRKRFTEWLEKLKKDAYIEIK